jgi:predicted transcriptional regulator
MPSKPELNSIDKFIKDYNLIFNTNIKRRSGMKQESPDAVLHLNEIVIGLEHTTALVWENENNSENIEILLERIKKKLLNDYKDHNMHEIWLLISEGDYVLDEHLKGELKTIYEIEMKFLFNRIFIHRATPPKLIEFAFKV